MITAADLVSEAFHPIPENASIEAAIRKAIESKSEYLILVGESGPRALISALALLSLSASNEIDLRNATIGSITINSCDLINEDDSIDEIFQAFKASKQTVFPVVNSRNELLGTISLRDVVFLLGHNLELRTIYE